MTVEVKMEVNDEAAEATRSGVDIAEAGIDESEMSPEAEEFIVPQDSEG